MGLPSYLLKKNDTYYFRQAWPQSVQSQIGKKEVIKSLGVSDKSLAVRMARELKVNLDDVVDRLLTQSLTTPQVAVDFLNSSLSQIKVKYQSNHRGFQIISDKPLIVSVPTTSIAPPENIIQNHTIISPSPRINKTKLIPLYEKYASEKLRLNQWTTKSFKGKNSQFLLIVSMLKLIMKVDEIHIEDIAVKDVRELKDKLIFIPKELGIIMGSARHLEDNDLDSICWWNEVLAAW